MPSASQPFVGAVCLIPASGEYVYDVTPFSGGWSEDALSPINCWFAPGGARTDMMYALDDLQESLPNCRAVALVVQWLGDSLDASQCRIYPSSTYIGGILRQTAGGSETAGTEIWRVSDLTLSTPGLIPISKPDGVHSLYGGTPSDASLTRALREIRRRGLRPSLYLQMNMDVPGQPWRGLCGFPNDRSVAAADAVANFLGPAQIHWFTPDAAASTVQYSGPLLDFSFRRFVLHYAWLCTLAGGVDLFAIGSELRGLECIRGPSWTPAGAVDASGAAIWDYPFVAGLQALLADCRAVFDSAGLSANVAARNNLVCYSVDWSCWTGAQHPDISGVFPHLDALWASPALDLVMIDNYMPLSDWTGASGLDAGNWRAPPPASWPLDDPQTLGFGLSSAPQIYDLAYLKSNIEGGERFHYFYADAQTAFGFDPSGAASSVTRPSGDRLAQRRSRYYPGQELFALKNLRWWWANPHRAVYDSGDGQGVAPHGPASLWRPQSKSIGFMEYGFPSISCATNEENVFYDPRSISGGVPFWCEWESVEGGELRPRADARLQYLAHRAFGEYWTSDGHNAVSASGLEMIASDLMFAWCWDARPFPCFPTRLDVWSDGGDWRAGHWLCGKTPARAPSAPDAPPSPPVTAIFPALHAKAWSVIWRPIFASATAPHVGGRETRRSLSSAPLWEIDMRLDLLTLEAWGDVRALIGFFDDMQGPVSPFLMPAPAELGIGPSVPCRFAEDSADLDEFMSRLFRMDSVKLRSLRS